MLSGSAAAASGGLKVERVARARWEAACAGFLDHNYRQTWAYGEALAARRGAACEHVAVTDGDGEVLGLADVRVKRLPVVGGGIAYVSGGPLTRRGRADDVGRLGRVLEGLKAEYCGRRGMVLRVVGPLGPAEWLAGAFGAAGFAPTARAAGYRTIVVDVGRPVEAVRAGLAQKWRNCLNAGERQGHRVVSGTEPELFARFARMFEAFVARKGFGVELGAEFYAGLQGRLSAGERLVVTLAEGSDGEAVAGHVCSMLGDTSVYLLGATTEAGLKGKAAYVLQWNAVAMARSRGLRWYDLGGIDPEGNPNVYHFKAGMGGVEASGVGPFEFRPSGVRASLTTRAEAAYTFLKRKRAAGRATEKAAGVDRRDEVKLR